MKTVRLLVCAMAGCVLAVGAAGCAGPGWTARKIRVTEGFDAPECVVVDPASETGYVTNIGVPPDQEGGQKYWTDDGAGFLSQLSPEGMLAKLRWMDSTPDAVLHAPKGMCILDGVLYVNDNTRIRRVSLRRNIPLRPIPVPGSQRLNDMATDGKAVFASDTGAGKVYRLRGGTQRTIQAPEGVNGITFHKGRMFAVSVSLRDVYELDPSGRGAPRPFGLAAHFAGLDGIEVLDDGSFIVSDLLGDKVSVISPDGKSVRTIARLEAPTDIGVNRKRGLLFVPQLKAGRVIVYELKKSP